MMVDSNPYTPLPSSASTLSSDVPHSLSVRSEAWRGVKFGTRITSIIMVPLAALFSTLAIALLVYAKATDSAAFRNLSTFEVARAVGGSWAGAVLSIVYGGIIGGVVMALLAGIRKTGRRSVADEPNSDGH